MKPDDSDITSLFAQQRVQYSVPHYQRPQAWRAGRHWEPLWADIEAKANAWFSNPKEAPKKHYLGAIVLAKRPKAGVKGMDRNIVIDGQQRLSTIQYVLKALSLLTQAHGYVDGTDSVGTELFNTDTKVMDKPEIQRFKLWPTFRDRQAHLQVMGASSLDDLRAAFPESFTKAGTLYVGENKHPRPLDCTWYFQEQISEWLDDLEGEDAITRGLEAVRRAVTESLQLIVLWLEAQDDPQVIFECLNGRGEPLRPTDLIKNFIFMAAEAEAGADELSEESPIFKLWSQLDEPPWLSPLTRGRLTQSRLEWLIYYSLQAETGQDLDTSRIYDSYQKWAPAKAKDGLSSLQQVEVLVGHANALQDFVNEAAAKPIGRFGKVAQALDVTTSTPVALAIARYCSPELQTQMFEVLSSYLVRREVCGLVKKSYNVLFPQILRELRKNGFTLEVLASYLSKLDGVTSMWPDNDRFTLAIRTRSLYSPGSSLCRLLLAAAANRIGEAHASEVQWSPDWSQLHLEHLMPQSWFEHWALGDGTFATKEEADQAPYAPKDKDGKVLPRVAGILARQALVNTLGNLTVLRDTINMDIKNFAWSVKRGEIREHTQLRMNYDITDEPHWGEAQIGSRGESLAELLCEVWRAPAPAEASA